MNGKTVFVGLSGGVDSSVAALRLKNEGYIVVGVFIKVWHPDFLVCNWEQERLDAMRVAAHLEIPFLTCDAVAAYEEGVAKEFINAYTEGYTPNPDVLCNQQVKFGAFLQFALTQGADFVATGHYAQKVQENDTFYLLRGADTNKDQSYFLWTLSQEQLAKILLPIGKSTKTSIRKEAEEAAIPTAQKKDSQGICFLGHVDIPEFLSHYTTLIPGSVLDESGATIGTHKGALVYTIGQRHGFLIHSSDIHTRPHYVIKKDVEANTITVSTTKPTVGTKDALHLINTNWIGTTPKKGTEYTIQTRYRQQGMPAVVEAIGDREVTLIYQGIGELSAAGQSCVLYDQDQCLGGGIIAA